MEQIVGNLPTELGLMSNLTAMVIVETSITGDLPVEYMNLRHLRDFQFTNNDLSGTIPTGKKKNKSGANIKNVLCYKFCKFVFWNIWVAGILIQNACLYFAFFPILLIEIGLLTNVEWFSVYLNRMVCAYTIYSLMINIMGSL